MTVQGESMPSKLSVYPYFETLRTADPTQALFVDICGGVGHRSALLRKALPEDITNKIIVQDQAPVIAQAESYPGVELMVHGFWRPNPVKNAKMSYVRDILDNWPDAKAVGILKNTEISIGPDSIVIIEEMVILGQGVYWQAAQLDTLMATALPSQERTQKQ